jgi:hypothetical protein
MIPFLLKKVIRYTRNLKRMHETERLINKKLYNQTQAGRNSFNFYSFKLHVNSLIASMQMGNPKFHYRYSSSCSKPTLYASAYACMTLSLLGDLQSYTVEAKREWADYFDSFQSSNDGLFYDPELINDLYAETDWWGARHLALHMISSYTDLGERPKYQFNFLKKYYDVNYITSWLDGFDFQGDSIGVGDIDNKIMNIGCLLQYQRDNWHDNAAGISVEFLKSYLRKKINKQTGMWGGFNINNPNQLSRMVQFAYHLFAIYFYDNEFDFDHLKIAKHVLQTQNKYGGYGVKYNSSACEDIDSIDILIRIYNFLPVNLKDQVNASINSALRWVLLNMVKDGGFVFRIDEPFHYGCDQTSSFANQGAMLPTWFRVLSIAYMTNHLSINQNFIITTCPGYEV